MSKGDRWPTMRIINAFAPTVPMWEIHYFPEEDKTWITPIICIAVVETRYKRAHPGEEAHFRNRIAAPRFYGRRTKWFGCVV